MAGDGKESEIRMGIVGTDNTHAYQFAAFINGWSEKEPVPARLPNGVTIPSMHLWALLLRRFEFDPLVDVPVSGARVTSIWSQDFADGERVARACNIERICRTPEAACENVDAVMVLSEDPSTHLSYAQPALERGLPTFVDKPFARNVDEALAIFDLAARFGARCFTASALRWCAQFETARDYARSHLGPIKSVYVPCPGSLDLYGIHSVEIANFFLGSDVHAVQTIGVRDRQVTLLEYRDSTSALLEHLNFIRWPIYSATLFGSGWEHRANVDMPSESILALVQEIVAFARGGCAPVPEAEAVRFIEIVAAARESLQSGRRIKCSPS